MQRVKLFGVKQDARGGTIYKVLRVNDSGVVIPDEKALDYLEFDELATGPSAPAANSVRLYAQDNGSGKTRIVAKFASGADVVLATQA